MPHYPNSSTKIEESERNNSGGMILFHSCRNFIRIKFSDRILCFFAEYFFLFFPSEDQSSDKDQSSDNYFNLFAHLKSWTITPLRNSTIF